MADMVSKGENKGGWRDRKWYWERSGERRGDGDRSGRHVRGGIREIRRKDETIDIRGNYKKERKTRKSEDDD